MKYGYFMILLCLLLMACSPAVPLSPDTTITATDVEIPGTSPIPVTSTPGNSSTVPVYPTLPPAPTSVSRSILHPGQLVRFDSFAMSDEQNGWAIDEEKHILHTRDGGHSWKNVTPYYGTLDMYINTRFSASGFFALDANTAWATTPSLKPCADESCTAIPNIALLWHTVDGGNTWQGQYLCLQGEECGGFPLIVPVDHFPMSIQFLDTQTGWMFYILGNGSEIRYRLYQTTDSGNSWSPVMDRSNLDPQDAELQRNVIGLAFQDDHTAWMSLAESKRDGTSIPIAEWKMYRSTDGGITWDKISLPAPDVSPDSFVPDPSQCYGFNMGVSPASVDATFYCYAGSPYYFHYHSYDGGSHWVTWQETGSSQFLDAFLGWRLTAHNDLYDLEQTQDGGITWTRIKTVEWNGALNFINEREGWVLARSINDIALVHTTNGGKGWDEIKPLTAE